MKKFIFYSITYFLIFVFLFLFLEVMRRVTAETPRNHHLFSITQKGSSYLFEPNSSIHSVTPERELEYTAHINSFGYRGADFEEPKAPDTTRIFLIGDSFTFGVGAQDDETIAALLQADLQKEGDRIEVVNAGVGHTSPVTHYVNIRDIHLKYQPDLVVLLFDMTDLWDDWHSERSAILDQNGEIKKFDINYIYGKRDWWRTCVYYSAACTFINNKIVRTFNKFREIGVKKYFQAWLQGKRIKAVIINSPKEVSQDALLEYDGLLLLRGREKKDLIDQNWPRTEKYIVKIRDLLAQHGIPLILAVYPHGLYVDVNAWSKGRATWGFEEGKKYTDHYPFELLETTAQRNHIPFINMLDEFLGAPPKKYFFDWDGHLTPEGNKLVVKSLLESNVFTSELKKVSSKNEGNEKP